MSVTHCFFDDALDDGARQTQVLGLLGHRFSLLLLLLVRLGTGGVNSSSDGLTTVGFDFESSRVNARRLVVLLLNPILIVGRRSCPAVVATLDELDACMPLSGSAE